MPALVAGIHVLLFETKDVDGRDKPGHDDGDGVLGVLFSLYCVAIDVIRTWDIRAAQRTPCAPFEDFPQENFDVA
jgi:hypothetical protein